MASVETEPSPETRAPRPKRRRRLVTRPWLVNMTRDPFYLIVTGLLLVPFVVGAVAVIGDPWYAASDRALLELRTRDVGPDTPLLGAFSRYGWNHPGPLMFWMLAPVYRLTGAFGWSMYTASAVLNGVAVVLLASYAYRRGGRLLLLVFGLLVALMLNAAGGDVLIDPWNPWLALLPFALFMLATWGMTDGDLWGLPLAVGAGSFIVQTHIGYGVIVGVVGLWGVAFVAVHVIGLLQKRSRWRKAKPELTKVAIATVVVAGLAWFGPVIDQFTNDPGNMTLIVEHFSAESEEPPAGGEWVGIMFGRELALFGPWMGGPEPIEDLTATVSKTSAAGGVPALLIFAATAVVAGIRRDWSALRLHGLVVVGLIGAAAGTARVTGIPFFYLLRFWWVVALFLWFAVLWTLLRALPEQLVERARPAGEKVVVGVIALVALLATTSTAERPERTTYNDAVAMLTPAVTDATGGSGTYLLQSAGNNRFETFLGLLNSLDRAGLDMKVEPRHSHQAGTARVVHADTPVDGVIFVATGDAIDQMRLDPTRQLVFEYQPLDAVQQEEYRRLKDQLTADLIAAGRQDLLPALENQGIRYLGLRFPGADMIAANRLADLLGEGQRAAVFIGPADPAVVTAAAARTRQ